MACPSPHWLFEHFGPLVERVPVQGHYWDAKLGQKYLEERKYLKLSSGSSAISS